LSTLLILRKIMLLPVRSTPPANFMPALSHNSRQAQALSVELPQHLQVKTPAAAVVSTAPPAGSYQQEQYRKVYGAEGSVLLAKKGKRKTEEVRIRGYNPGGEAIGATAGVVVGAAVGAVGGFAVASCFKSSRLVATVGAAAGFGVLGAVVGAYAGQYNINV
jgi:hypothetical protein